MRKYVITETKTRLGFATRYTTRTTTVGTVAYDGTVTILSRTTVPVTRGRYRDRVSVQRTRF